jgi:hypothetical protein
MSSPYRRARNQRSLDFTFQIYDTTFITHALASILRHRVSQLSVQPIQISIGIPVRLIIVYLQRKICFFAVVNLYSGALSFERAAMGLRLLLFTALCKVMTGSL